MAGATKDPNRGNPSNRRIDGPDLVQERRPADRSAASRLAVAKAPLGGELTGEPPADETSEVAGALKRAAENDGRV